MTDKEIIKLLQEENKRLWATIERLMASPHTTINCNSNTDCHITITNGNSAGNDISITN